MLLLGAGVISNAQDMPPAKKQEQQAVKPERKFWDRVSLGGYLGAQFGTVTNIDISPLMIYEITPSFYAGLGFTYLFYRDKRYQPYYTSNGYGANALTRYHVWRDLFVQLEYDPLNFTYYSDYDPFGNYVGWHKENTWVHDLLIGAGYRQWIGGRAFATLALFWNVNETIYSPYRNPIIRIGFGVGL